MHPGQGCRPCSSALPESDQDVSGDMSFVHGVGLMLGARLSGLVFGCISLGILYSADIYPRSCISLSIIYHAHKIDFALIAQSFSTKHLYPIAM